MLPENNDLYMSVYGSPQIRYDMFTRARLRDPNAKLFLNDFSVVNNGKRTNVSDVNVCYITTYVTLHHENHVCCIIHSTQL